MHGQGIKKIMTHDEASKRVDWLEAVDPREWGSHPSDELPTPKSCGLLASLTKLAFHMMSRS
jgi:hypothetical protein